MWDLDGVKVSDLKPQFALHTKRTNRDSWGLRVREVHTRLYITTFNVLSYKL